MSGNDLLQNLMGFGIIIFIFAMIYFKVKGESMFTMFKKKYEDNKPKVTLRRGI